MLALVFFVAPQTAAALQQIGGLRAVRSAVRRPAAIVMGEASTKEANEWKFVKGINDYGKDVTYMYLGAKDKADDGSSPLSKPVLDILPEEWNFLLKPYFIMLFSPLVLATACLILL